MEIQLPRIPIPRTPLNKGKEIKARAALRAAPALSALRLGVAVAVGEEAAAAGGNV